MAARPDPALDEDAMFADADEDAMFADADEAGEQTDAGLRSAAAAAAAPSSVPKSAQAKAAAGSDDSGAKPDAADASAWPSLAPAPAPAAAASKGAWGSKPVSAAELVAAHTPTPTPHTRPARVRVETDPSATAAAAASSPSAAPTSTTATPGSDGAGAAETGAAGSSSADAFLPAPGAGERCEVIVVDTAGFIKNSPLERLANEVYTIREVVAEIREREVRERLAAVMPYELKFREPSAEAIKTVADFAKHTGDYRSLSATDIRVMALAYTMEVERNGTEHIRRSPRDPIKRVEPDRRINRPCRFAMECHRPDCWFVHPDQDGYAEVVAAAEAHAAAQQQQAVDKPGADGEPQTDASAPQAPPAPGQAADKAAPAVAKPEEDDDDDGVGWITPDNFREVAAALVQEQGKSKQRVQVGCMTTDFAMQNVLLQMGLNVVALDGMLVKRVKTFALRCSACMRPTHEVTRDFCPHCGNNALYKVQVHVDRAGKCHYSEPRYHKMTTRGTKFPLPLPKGGRHDNVIVTEDQKERLRPMQKSKEFDIFNADTYTLKTTPFSKAQKASAPGRPKPMAAGAGRRNPNERKGKRK